MNKVKQNNNTVTQLNSVTMPKLIKQGYYRLLISNAGISFRKSLSDKLDSLFKPKLGFIGWKNRFLYPERNIPKKNIELISTAMEEALAREIEIQTVYLSEQIKIKNKDLKKLKDSIINLEVLLIECKKAIKEYKNETAIKQNAL